MRITNKVKSKIEHFIKNRSNYMRIIDYLTELDDYKRHCEVQKAYYDSGLNSTFICNKLGWSKSKFNRFINNDNPALTRHSDLVRFLKIVLPYRLNVVERTIYDFRKKLLELAREAEKIERAV